jgi:mRNA-degrading endonuclease RelE of RelBE toxin-antitoxin system
MGLSFEVIFLPEAEDDIENLDPSVRKRCLQKIEWLSSHTDALGKKPLQNLPLALKGLNSYTIGDWQILYWVYPSQKCIKIYGIQHRSSVYKHFR